MNQQLSYEEFLTRLDSFILTEKGNCPVTSVLQLLQGKWKMQIICALNNRGTLRYNELRRKMDGISNTVLASSLRELEEEGLVIRKEYMEVPIRVEYSTTALCDRLMPILESLSDWGEVLMKERGMPTISDVAQAGQEARKTARR